MFFAMTASTTRRSSVGLNCTDLAAGLVLDRNVTGRRVERVSGLKDLIALTEAIRQPALEHNVRVSSAS
jgi:hypothetical protein